MLFATRGTTRARTPPQTALPALGFAPRRGVLACAGATTAGDWPQFRGPNGSAVSDETGLPVKDLDFHGEVFILKNWGISAYGAREFQTGVWRQADFGIVYRDQCIRVEILYNRNDTNNGVLGPSQGVGFRLSLATFGNSVYSRSEAETQPVPP
jgi:hypothetical protein